MSSTSQEWYVYNASGSRALRRSTDGSSTSLTVYAFGREEHVYTSSGSNQGNTYYYTLAGHLVGKSDGGSTTFYQTDLLGSVVADLSNTAGGAAIRGNEMYGPYGKQRYNQGTQGTPKGFTGQYDDALTGLDYYIARYYDPAVGVFLSADAVQGNAQGMNPYAYVGGNPETDTDPTGQYFSPAFLLANGLDGTPLAGRVPVSSGTTTVISTHHFSPAFLLANGLDGTPLAGRAPSGGWGHPVVGRGSGAVHRSVGHRSVPRVVHHSSQSLLDRLGHGIKQLGGWLSNIWHDLTGPTPPGEVNNPLGMPCGPLTLSFAPLTKVATSQGEKAIGSLHPGERVWAYNLKTHKMELEPVVHVWINHDNDLVDVTIASTIPAQHGKAAQKTSEVVHTNQKHPFLTVEKGFVPVSQLRVDMHVMKADGGAGTITMLKAVPGTMTMYNLEIAQDHTYTVGEGEWIVHNCGGPVGNVGPVGSNEDPTDNITMQDILNNPQLLKNLSPQQVELIAARDGGWVTGPLRKTTIPGGETFNQLNSRGTAFTDKYIQWHPGGGRHGPNPIWKVSTNKGIEHVDYEGPNITGGDTTGGDTTGGDIPGGDIPDLIDP